MGDIRKVSPEFVRRVSNRLNRCEGHLRSIRGMVSEGRSCDTLFVQLAAVRAAINEISLQVYENHIDHCLARDRRQGKERMNKELKFISKMLLSGRA